MLTPTQHEYAPISTGVIRAESNRIFRFTETKENETTFELLFDFDLKGNFPSIVTENVLLPIALAAPARIQRYFLQMKELKDFDLEGVDGRMLARVMMDEISSLSGDRRDLALATFIHRTAALRQVILSHSWFKDLIVNISIGNRRFVKFESSGRSDIELRFFTSKDASASSKKLMKLILGNPPALAVSEWIGASAALRQLDAEVVMFRPFVTGIVDCLLDRVDWGLRLRVL